MVYYQFCGMNLICIGFCWEWLQLVFNGEFDVVEFVWLCDFVDGVMMCGFFVLLDLYNYVVYKEISIGMLEVFVVVFVDFWCCFVLQFKDNLCVQFGFVNELCNLFIEIWVLVVQVVVDVICQMGVINFVVVFGNGYIGVWSWFELKWYGMFNVEIMGQVCDLLDCMVFEVY